MKKRVASVETSQKTVFVVMNPSSGNASPREKIEEALAQHFPPPVWTPEIYEITGQKDEDITALCRQACERGAALVIAAGGDGTVVGVANGLINGSVPLGLLPAGTGNDLARILNIPLNQEQAVAALAGETVTLEIDALRVGDEYYLSNVSAGISPAIMDETGSTEKKRLGRLAYLLTLLRRLNLLQRHPYRLTIDGQPVAIHASEVMVSNTTLLESLPGLFGPPEDLHDGQLEVYLVTARHWRDYLQLAWDVVRGRKSAARLVHLSVKKSIRIEAHGRPQLVQADGEVIGHTPVEVELVPRAIRVIMPVQDSATKA